MRIENHFSQFFGKYRKEVAPVNTETSQEQLDLEFAMESSGFSLSRDGKWKYQENFLDKANKDWFFLDFVIGRKLVFKDGVLLAHALQQKPVMEMIRNCRKFDDNAARHIFYLLGNVVTSSLKHLDYPKAAKAVEFTARMINLTELGYGENIAIPLAMYFLSGGSFEKDAHFEGNINRMAEAIVQTDFSVTKTEEMDISQALRLNSFWQRIQGSENQKNPPYYYSSKHTKAFVKFPTIGAEFHIPVDSGTYRDFWQRVTILNMAQYQRGSFIPFSRNDQDILEIRMNPSIYPITIANWNLMRLILPELNQCSFSITVNREQKTFQQAKMIQE